MIKDLCFIGTFLTNAEISKFEFGLYQNISHLIEVIIQYSISIKKIKI